MKLGIGKQSDLRARAGVEYVLQELTEDGHCTYRRADLVKKIPHEFVTETAGSVLGAPMIHWANNQAGGQPPTE